MLIAVQDPPTLVVLQQGFENSKLFVMEVIDNQTNKIKARYFYDDSSSLMSAIINHIDFSLEEDECDNLLFRDSCSSIGTSTSEIDRIIEEFMQKYPFTEIERYLVVPFRYKIIKVCSLTAFYEMEKILKDFERKYPLTKICQE